MSSPLERVKDVTSLAYLSDDSPAVVNTADLRAIVRVVEAPEDVIAVVNDAYLRADFIAGAAQNDGEAAAAGNAAEQLSAWLAALRAATGGV